jgi:hypothetical protein
MIMTCTGSLVNNAHKRKLQITVPVTKKKCRISLPPFEVIVIQYTPLRNPVSKADHPWYTRDGTHRPICGKRYRSSIAKHWITMNGIIPMKIWLSVTCGGATPFR